MDKSVEYDPTQKSGGTSPSPLDSIREDVLTVSPNKQYRGIFKPTTPAHTGPGHILPPVKPFHYSQS